MRGKVLERVTGEYLKKNKMRTLVTIAGILLSTAMITAVIVILTSMQDYLLREIIASEGSWEGCVRELSGDELHQLTDDERVKGYTTLQSLGYAKVPSTNESKPFLYVAAVEENIEDYLVLNLTAGRMPENANEILLPVHLAVNGEVQYKLGEQLSLQLGERRMDGDQRRGQWHWYFAEEESFQETESRSYTVVGFYERPNFEDHMAPGYTALTVQDGTGAQNYTAYVKMNRLRDIHAFFDTHKEWNTEKHRELLRYSGASDEELLWDMFLPLATVLIGVIVFGSVSLIYNAFAISVSERKKQFGVLGSVGATRKQLRKSVLYEGMCLCIIGVPLGLLAGVAGIWVTFRCTADQFARLGAMADVELRVSVSPLFLLLAAVLAVLTVMLSAYLPARKASCVSPMESIRQTTEVAIHGKQVRTPKWVYRLFGLEGMLANKNFRRNKKKYRATVFSLFVSVVLFISAGSLCEYLEKSLDVFTQDFAQDIEFELSGTNAECEDPDELKNEVQKIDGMEDVVYSGCGVVYLNVQKSLLTEAYLAMDKEATGERIACTAYFLEDTAYRSLLLELGCDPEEYFREENAKVLFTDSQSYWTEEGRKKELAILDEAGAIEVTLPCGEEELSFGTFSYDTKVKEPCLGITHMDGLQIIFPYTRYEKYLESYETVSLPDGSTEDDDEIFVPESRKRLFFAMTVESHDEAYKGLVELLQTRGLSTSSVADIAAERETERALIVILNVFSYGFIVLISLIAMANVFNTVSTNVLLRRREFAMLRSVGMTQKGFHRMMNYECILYGVKGLMYGLPVAIGITYLIYNSVSNGMEFDFFLPWMNIGIAVGSVFLVVFASMLYAMSKIRNDNTMDVIKNENL